MPSASLTPPPKGERALLWTLLGFAILLAVLIYGALSFYQEQRLMSDYGAQGGVQVTSQGLFKGALYRQEDGSTVPYDDASLRQLYFVLLTFIWLSGLLLALRIRHRLRALSQESEQNLREQAERAVHDLKSPLSALKMIAEYPGSVSPKLKPILQGATGRVEKIIRELEYRALAKLQDPTDTSPFELTETLQHLVTELRWNKKFAAAGCRITSSEMQITVTGLPRVELERHLMNLIVNGLESALSCKQVLHAGLVEVSLREEEESGVKIEIKDNGTGLNPKCQHKYFQRGFSSKKGRLRGRGLYYARKFARSFGGEVTLEPREDNQGAICTFQIPKEKILPSQKSAPTLTT